MPPISVLIKPASGLCNMRCDYCFYCDETAKRRQASYGLMSLDTLKNVIRKCVIPAEGSCTIAFQGGEPTLCGLPFFEKAVEYFQKASELSPDDLNLHYRIGYNLERLNKVAYFFPS